jgi:hypothetical protein
MRFNHTIFLTLFLAGVLYPEPIVLTGKMLPAFLGRNIQNIRVTDRKGASIPFQIDEVENNDYVCPDGKEPNNGNGLLDTADEIVFLWEDADKAGPLKNRRSRKPDNRCVITMSHGAEKRFVYLSNNPSIPLSTVSYIEYDDNKERISTPYYYACFGHDRFHFTHAGIKDCSKDAYLDLTNELRIKIFLKTLWGLLPITYTEKSIVCLVKRYKAGPVRLIRRGDFYLDLGLFLQGSNAAVNQICYPQMVRVPVYLHLPIRFRVLFKEAYIEMTPVFTDNARDFSFEVPSRNLLFPLGTKDRTDTLVQMNPNHSCMTVHNNAMGYGWLLDAAMEERMLDGSGYCVSIPSERFGIGHCGFRLTVRDLPKGYYLIGNWVLFSKNGIGGLLEACDRLSVMATLNAAGNPVHYCNQLDKIMPFRKR